MEMEGIGLEFEARKEKKKRHKGKASSLIQVCGSEMGKVVEADKKRKKKRKREKKGDGTMLSNVSDGEGILEDDGMNVVAEYEDDAEVNKEAGDMKKTSGKLKRGKAGGGLVQNVRTDGVEPEVESQDVNIVKKGDFAVKESKLLETIAEKVETERSEVQEKVVVENEDNVQSTASERCIGDMEAVVVDDREQRKKKKAKSETRANIGDVNRDVEAVNVEDGKRRKKKAKSEKDVNVEDTDRKMESLNVDDKRLRKNKVDSEKHANLDDTDREMEAVNLDGNTRKKEKKKTKVVKHVHIESINRSMEAGNEAVITEDGEKNKATDAGSSQLDGPSDEHQGLVRGKRFSKEEDKILREAVLRYIEEHGLGDDGLEMVLHCRSHPEVKNHPKVLDCWKVIGEAIPWRPHKSVYSRAHILFERSDRSA